MKKLLATALLLPTFAFAADPALENLSKSELEKISKEVSVNLSHSAVSAPETDGLWGIEVGLVGGRTDTPEFADQVEDAGEDGDDFEKLPHAGLLIRGHFPLEIFAEIGFLPTVKAADVEVQSRSFTLGWNAGGFFSLPLDLAVAAEYSRSELEFDQTINAGTTDATINFESKTRRYWVGASKTFFTFLTPYAKFGTFSSESDVDVNAVAGTIFNYTTSQKASVSSSGTYYALGLNADALFMRFGLEVSRSAEVGRASAKVSVAF